MNITKHELIQNKNSTIIWVIAILAIALLYISIFSTVNKDIVDLIKNFPPAFKKTFGISEAGFSTLPALYALVLNLVILAGAVQAMNLGVGIISKEVSDKTVDFLLSKPISRFNMLTQKLFAGIVLILLTNVIFLVGAWGLINIFVENPFSFSAFFTCSFTLFLLQSLFFALGFFAGVVLPKVRSVIAVTLPTVFGFYVFGMLDTVIGEEKIKYLTPFKFFKLEKLASGSGYEAWSLIYLGLIILILIIASYFIYQKKDIHTV